MTPEQLELRISVVTNAIGSELYRPRSRGDSAVTLSRGETEQCRRMAIRVMRDLAELDLQEHDDHTEALSTLITDARARFDAGDLIGAQRLIFENIELLRPPRAAPT